MKRDKISITLDIDKFRDVVREKKETRTYKNREGEEVTVNEVRLDIVPVREEKLIKQGDGWLMKKTHFVAETTTKEERAGGKKGSILGDGIVFEQSSLSQEDVDYIKQQKESRIKAEEEWASMPGDDNIPF